MKDDVAGGCFCGAVRFTVHLPTLFCGHCHCSMCRRAHSSGCVTWFGVPYTQFRLEQGESSLVRFSSSEHGRRSFCGRCGSQLLCESSRHPEHLDIALAAMDEEIDRPPQFHVYFSDRVEWLEVVDRLPKMGGESGTEPLPE